MICTKSCNLLLDDLAQSIFYLEWRTFGLDLDFDFGGFCLRLLDCHVISELVQAEGIEPPILQRASGLQPDERHRSRPAKMEECGRIERPSRRSYRFQDGMSHHRQRTPKTYFPTSTRHLICFTRTDRARETVSYSNPLVGNKEQGTFGGSP